jgi:hypothetical protein
VNQFFVEQLAYIARKLDAIQEGPRTLLDNTMLMHCSSMMAGAKHGNDQLPIIVIVIVIVPGGAGGRLKSGRALDYKDKPERQMCRLFISMMDKMNQHPKKDLWRCQNHAGGSVVKALVCLILGCVWSAAAEDHAFSESKIRPLPVEHC